MMPAIDEVKDYEALVRVLNKALYRASRGKGKQRHATEGQRFEQQDICTELDYFGPSPALYQIRKKAKECVRLPTLEMQIGELLDIIVYAAAAIIHLEGGNPEDE